MAFGLGIGFSHRLNNGSASGGPTRGPELITTPFDQWTASSGAVTVDATGITYTAAGAGAHARLSLSLEDNATYEVIVTLSTYTSGAFQPNLYGPSIDHRGFVVPSISAAGTYSQTITTSGNVSGVVNQIRLISSLANGTFKVTACSVKKVLA